MSRGDYNPDCYVIPEHKAQFLRHLIPQFCHKSGAAHYTVPQWAHFVNQTMMHEGISTRAATMALRRLAEDEGRVGDAFMIQVRLVVSMDHTSAVPSVFTQMIKELRKENGDAIFNQNHWYPTPPKDEE